MLKIFSKILDFYLKISENSGETFEDFQHYLVGYLRTASVDESIGSEWKIDRRKIMEFDENREFRRKIEKRNENFRNRIPSTATRLNNKNKSIHRNILQLNKCQDVSNFFCKMRRNSIEVQRSKVTTNKRRKFSFGNFFCICAWK